jgi:thioredoxin 2
MEQETVIVACPNCGAKNKIPRNRLQQHPRCGRCHHPLPLTSETVRPLHVTDVSFGSDVLQHTGVVLLMFWSPRCPYCRQLSPVIDQLAVEYAGRVLIAKLDVDQNHTVPSQFAVNGVPTLIIVKNGKVLNRLVGVLPKADLEKALLSVL